MPLPLGPVQQPNAGAALAQGTATLSPGGTYYSSGPAAAPANLPSGQPPYAVGITAPLGPGQMMPGQMMPGSPSAGLQGQGLSGLGVMAAPMPAMQPPPAADPTLPPPRLMPTGPAGPGPAGGLPPQIAPPPETGVPPGPGAAPLQAPPLPVSMNLDELRQEITRLQTERRTLAAERASLADALPGLRCSPAQNDACTNALQDRLRSLMEQLRRPPPELPPSEPAPLPPPRPAIKETPARAPDPPGLPARDTRPAPAPPAGDRPSPKGKASTADKSELPKKERHELPATAPLRVDTPIEPLGLAQALFQTGDYEGALKAYRILERSNPSAETMANIQYMMASCLRKLGKMDEAAALYREVAAFDGDDLMAETAQWQLSTMKARRELDSQLQQLKQRRGSLLEKKQ